ncbi:MAG: hypothetical protein ABIV94_01510 [Acidimicrobiales bacterium]
MARGERYVVLGLAHVRSEWFRQVGRWATSAALPLEFVKVLSVEELRARLGSGRALSAVLVDSGLPGVDRDLLETARLVGCAVIVVDSGRVERDWAALGANAVLPVGFDRGDLHDALGAVATVIGRGEAVALGEVAPPPSSGWRGRLVAVTGPGGAGSSTVAMALAQGLGADPRYAGLVLLADLALDADQAMLHDVGDVVPGIQEVVEAHRGGQPSIQDLRGLAFALADRPYALLLGLRRHRDWVGIRPRAFEASLDGLRRCYQAVVADVTGDVEGEDECGSLDVEERNVMARTTVRNADAVVLVANSGPRGLHRLVRLIASALDHGVVTDRIVPVINRAPRSPRGRAEITAALAKLARPLTTGGAPLGPPVQLPDRRRLDEVLRDGVPLPGALAAPVTAAVEHVLSRRAASVPLPTEPSAIQPGSLGSFYDQQVRRA